jgi:hypothetical protein
MEDGWQGAEFARPGTKDWRRGAKLPIAPQCARPTKAVSSLDVPALEKHTSASPMVPVTEGHAV